MTKKELDSLIIDIQNGDEKAFALFYENTYRGVFSFIYSYVHSWFTAEDILQETYIKVKLNISKYKLGTNINAWLLQIAKNNCLDYLRKRKLQPTEEYKEYKAIDNREIDSGLYAHDLLIKHLGNIDRQIVLLHILYGYKNKEIAKILDLPMGTVLWRYNRAIKLLKNKIKEDCYER